MFAAAVRERFSSFSFCWLFFLLTLLTPNNHRFAVFVSRSKAYRESHNTCVGPRVLTKKSFDACARENLWHQQHNITLSSGTHTHTHMHTCTKPWLGIYVCFRLYHSHCKPICHLLPFPPPFGCGIFHLNFGRFRRWKWMQFHSSPNRAWQSKTITKQTHIHICSWRRHLVTHAKTFARGRRTMTG